jgi:hypothetical protein
MKTAVQELFTKLEKEHPSLFNVHSVTGREFINDYYQFLEMEKQQIIDAYDAGQKKEAKEEFWTKGTRYYNENYKQD